MFAQFNWIHSLLLWSRDTRPHTHEHMRATLNIQSLSLIPHRQLSCEIEGDMFVLFPNLILHIHLVWYWAVTDRYKRNNIRGLYIFISDCNFSKRKKKLKQSKDRYFFLRKELVIKLLKHKHCRVVKSNNVADEKKQKNNVADDQWCSNLFIILFSLPIDAYIKFVVRAHSWRNQHKMLIW